MSPAGRVAGLSWTLSANRQPWNGSSAASRVCAVWLARAQEIGIPDRYDYGAQRMSWLFHVLTNWMGDTGFITKLYGELRRFNVVGDTTWIKATVTRTYTEEGKHLVDLDVWGENQRGEMSTPGRATVQLPSREDG